MEPRSWDAAVGATQGLGPWGAGKSDGRSGEGSERREARASETSIFVRRPRRRGARGSGGQGVRARGARAGLTWVSSSVRPASAAMRHSVVGSGCLLTLLKLYSKISTWSWVGPLAVSADMVPAGLRGRSSSDEQAERAEGRRSGRGRAH